jgi:hypothetical protein
MSNCASPTDLTDHRPRLPTVNPSPPCCMCCAVVVRGGGTVTCVVPPWQPVEHAVRVDRDDGPRGAHPAHHARAGPDP